MPVAQSLLGENEVQQSVKPKYGVYPVYAFDVIDGIEPQAEFHCPCGADCATGAA